MFDLTGKFYSHSLPFVPSSPSRGSLYLVFSLFLYDRSHNFLFSFLLFLLFSSMSYCTFPRYTSPLPHYFGFWPYYVSWLCPCIFNQKLWLCSMAFESAMRWNRERIGQHFFLGLHWLSKCTLAGLNYRLSVFAPRACQKGISCPILNVGHRFCCPLDCHFQGLISFFLQVFRCDRIHLAIAAPGVWFQGVCG